MGSWWNSIKRLASGLAGVVLIASTASAQFQPPAPGGYGMPPRGGMMAPPPGMTHGLPMGNPGAGGPPPGAFGGGPGGGGPPPGAFGGNPALGGMPADFPNPGVPSKEPVSPFSIKDDGLPNAFSILNDPRPRVNPYFWTIRGEYLNWQISSTGPSVVLVTTTSNSPIERGALDQPNTSIVVPARDRK